MATKDIKVDTSEVGALFDIMNKKRAELPPTAIQRVEPVPVEKSQNPKSDESIKHENTEIQKPEIAKLQNSKNTKLQISLIAKTQKQENIESRGQGGRPSTKDVDVTYVRIGPRVPKELKQATEMALVQERFRDDEGRPIVTLDEIVTLALRRLLK